jgi:hypothetical protein
MQPVKGRLFFDFREDQDHGNLVPPDSPLGPALAGRRGASVGRDQCRGSLGRGLRQRLTRTAYLEGCPLFSRSLSPNSASEPHFRTFETPSPDLA